MSPLLLITAGLMGVAPVLASVVQVKLNEPLALGGQVVTMQISPDGNYVVYLADHTLEGMVELYSVAVAGGSPTRLYSPLDGIYGPPTDLAISADSSRVVFRAEHPDHDFSHNLYSVPIDGGPVLQVNADLPSVAYDVYDFQISSNSQRVVFRGDFAAINVDELGSAPIDGGLTVKLSGALVSGGDVQGDYQISADDNWVVYRADQQTDDVYEVYGVPAAGGTAVKLNASLVDTGDIWEFAVTPDSSRVLYRGDQDTASLNELYSVPIGGGTAIRLSGPQSYVGVFNFVISPDSSLAVYRADPDASTEYELFTVPVTGGDAEKLVAVPFLREVLPDYQITPDGGHAVFRADLDTRSVDELYSVPLGGGAPTKLNGALTSDGDVLSFRISPDSSRVAYHADQEGNDVYELFGAPVGGGAAVKLNDPLTSGGDVQDDYQISGDSGHTVYRADQNADETFELFSVPLAGGNVVRLNGALRPEGDVSAFVTSPDGSQTVYSGGQATGSSQSVYVVPTGGGLPRRLDDSRAVVGDVMGMVMSPDGQWVVYRAEGRQDEVLELFSVPAGGGPAIRLNDTPVAYGDVQGDYQIDPDSARVVYRADQAIDGVYELFSVPAVGGTPVRLNPALDDGRFVRSFLISPDGSRVVYEASVAASGDFQLFSTPTAGGPVATLTEVLPGVDRIRFQITPDSSTVLYLSGFDALYSVPIDGGTPVPLFDADSGHIVFFSPTPDSSGVVLLDYDTYDLDALYYVPTAGGVPVRLDAPAHSSEPDIDQDFETSPDGSRVVYRGDQQVSGRYELYSVPTSGGPPLKLNDTLVAEGDVTGFQISPDSNTVVYRADQAVDGYHELYRVSLGGGDAVRISYPLYPGDDIENIFFIAPDGGHVFYIINQGAGSYRDLYLFAASLTEPITYPLAYLYAPNNDSMPIEPQQFKVGADGRNLVYAGVVNSGEPVGLYSVPLAGGTIQRLDGPLTLGGEVDRLTFRVSPDSQTAVYRADQDTDDVFELYASTRVAAANLYVQKTASPEASAGPGQTLTYQLRFGNSGELTATGVVISDTIPVELTGVSYDSSGAAVTPIGGELYRWQIEDLDPGAVGAITVTGVIRPEVSLGTAITNRAWITSTTAEADGGDNESEVTTTVITRHKIYLPLVMKR